MFSLSITVWLFPEFRLFFSLSFVSLPSTLTLYPFRLEKSGVISTSCPTAQRSSPTLFPSISCDPFLPVSLHILSPSPPLPSFVPHLLCDGSPLVLEILAHFEDSGDWQQAFFKTLPERKVSPSCCAPHPVIRAWGATHPLMPVSHTCMPRTHTPHAYMHPHLPTLHSLLGLQGAVKPGERLPQEASLTIPTVREDTALSNSAPAFSHDNQQKVDIYTSTCS